jgi:hypothetical protein
VMVFGADQLSVIDFFPAVGLVNETTSTLYPSSVMFVNAGGTAGVYTTNAAIITAATGDIIALENLTTQTVGDGHLVFGDPASQSGASPTGVGASIMFQLLRQF